MIRVPIAQPFLGQKEKQYVNQALQSGWISGRGPYVQQFETKFVDWLGVRHGVATSSGTSALHLALASLGIKSPDEVIIPAFSMAAIPFAVSYVGARPVLADSESASWNVDPAQIERKITPRTKAVLVMHTYGHPADMDPIIEMAHKHGLFVVEDAAEAHGAQYKGKKVGTLGDVGCFSFFANKIITTGEGGMVVTNDDELAKTAGLLRDMAFQKDPLRKFVHTRVGYNYRLTNLQAALGLAQLERIDEFVEIRRRNASTYASLLRNIKGIKGAPQLAWAKNVYWMYSVLVDEPEYGSSRDDLMRYLESSGVETRPFFTPIHQQPVYRESYKEETFPVADTLSMTGLNLPSGNTLTKEAIGYVVNCISAFEAVKP